MGDMFGDYRSKLMVNLVGKRAVASSLRYSVSLK